MTRSDRPLVSVVTATRERHDDLTGAILTTQTQTYPNLEHVIVSDGPDPVLAERFGPRDPDFEASHDVYIPPLRVPLRYFELGHHTTSRLTYSYAAVPFSVAVWLARGEYILWLADDQRMTPDHIEALVDLLEERGVDFVYSQAEVHHKDRPDDKQIIGTYPPVEGQITNVLHRWDCLDVPEGYFRPHIGRNSDWYQISHWLEAGKTCAMLHRTTFFHRSDL